MAGFNNSRAIATAVLMPATAAPDPVYGPIGSIYINSNRFVHSYGTQNSFIGRDSGNTTLIIGASIGNAALGSFTLASLTTGAANTCIGDSSGSAITTGSNNTGCGIASLEDLTTGNENTAIGSGSLALLQTGGFNTAVGSGALSDVTTGSANTALGVNAGTNYTTESSNLVVGNIGTVADANWIRIGQQGNGLGQQNKCNIAGIYGVTPASVTTASVIIDDNGQLGTVPGGAGAIDTITGNDGIPISPILGNFTFLTSNTTVEFLGSAGTETLNFGNTNLILGSKPAIAGAILNVGLGASALSNLSTGQSNIGIGNSALSSLTTGNFNTAVGANALGIMTTAGFNTAVGYNALNANTADSNTAVGFGALGSTTTGDSNVAVGVSTLLNNTIGIGNTAVGNNSGGNITTGSLNTLFGRSVMGSITTGIQNIAIGYAAGSSCTVGSESSNIYIGSTGAAGESNTIRIGDDGSGFGQQNRAFMAGVYGVTPASAPELVIIDAAGQLGSAGGGIPTATVIVTTSITMSPNTQYIIQAAAPVNLLLPATSIVGDVIRIIGDSNLWTITQAAGQQISYVGFDTTLGVAGSVASLQGSDCAELICVAGNTRWTIFNGSANLNLV